MQLTPERAKDKGPLLASKHHLNELIRKKILEPLIQEDYDYDPEEGNPDHEYMIILVLFQ